MRTHHSDDVSQLVSRILREESIESCSELCTTHLTEEQRDGLKELLRTGESPVLSCDVACGPG